MSGKSTPLERNESLITSADVDLVAFLAAMRKAR